MAPLSPIEDTRLLAEPTAALVARMQQAGPRYTSYPTAVEFHDGIDAAAYGARLDAASQNADTPLALYAHFPFCEQRCHFCACHMIATKRRDRTEPYIERLIREIDLVADRLGDRNRISQLHWGGGTPTYFDAEHLVAVMNGIRRRFTLTPDAEVSLEVDPRVTSREQLAALAGVGFNRVSMGVQDLDPQVQTAIGRVQPFEMTESLVADARDLGYRSVNVDLVYGLPHQTVDNFDRTLDRVLELQPDRVAVYGFAYVPWHKGTQRRIDPATLPGADARIDLLLLTRRRFLELGYVEIGIDHFARPDDDLAIARSKRELHRNFMGYTTSLAPDMVGVGVSSIGEVAGAFVQNSTKLAHWERSIDAGELPTVRGYALTADDHIRRALILDLMCHFSIDRRALERTFDIDFATYFAADLARLAPLVDDGLVEIDDDEVRVTPLGHLFTRNVAMAFDAHLQAKRAAKDGPRFSSTV